MSEDSSVEELSRRVEELETQVDEVETRLETHRNRSSNLAVGAFCYLGLTWLLLALVPMAGLTLGAMGLMVTFFIVLARLGF